MAPERDGQHRTESGSWLVLTGAPNPDVTMVLVHEGDESTLDDLLHRIEDQSCPALVMLAGDGLELTGGLPEGWDPAGVMPMMTVALGATATIPDDRVGLVGPDDVDMLTPLLAEYYGLPDEIATILSEATARGGDDLQAWLLEGSGQPVLTVTTGRPDDTVSVWAMGTPERLVSQAGQPVHEATDWRPVEGWAIFTNAASAELAG